MKNRHQSRTQNIASKKPAPPPKEKAQTKKGSLQSLSITSKTELSSQQASNRSFASSYLMRNFYVAHLKIIAIIGCSLLWLLVAIVRLPENPRQTADIGIDHSWVFALPETLHQQSISGRDFHFTYGPLSQALAYAGASLHSPWSVISSLPLILLAFHTASILLVGGMLFLIKDFSWKETLFIYLALAGLNLFSDPTAFRPLSLMVCSVLLFRALQERAGARKWLWAAITGAGCFAAQLLTVELGLYSILAALISGLAWMLMHPRTGRKQTLFSISIILAVYLAANFAIDCFFVLSSPAYHFLDYQRYALESIRGFAYSQSLPWMPNISFTIGTIIAASLAIYIVLFLIAKRRPAGLLFLPMLICSLITLKSMTVRSDGDHVIQACGPLVFLLIAAGATLFLRRPINKVAAILWAAAFAILWPIWPAAGTHAATDLYRATSSLQTFQKFFRLRTEVVHPEDILPKGLAAQIHSSTSPLLPFPYECYIPVAMKRRIAAPILMAYNASTETLQQFYIQKLEEERDLEVLYGIEGQTSIAIDGIPILTRAPKIFMHLQQHFQVNGGKRYGNGFYLLKRRNTPLPDLPCAKVDMQFRQADKSTWEILPREASTGNLLSLEIEIDYPFWQILGHPAPLDLVFFKNGSPLLKTGLYAIKPGAPFQTLISIGGKTWDRILISTRVNDPLGIAPQRIDIRSIGYLTNTTK